MTTDKIVAWAIALAMVAFVFLAPQRWFQGSAWLQAPARVWLRRVGFVTRVLVYALLLGINYALWPTGITDRPLAELTLGAIFQCVGVIVIFLLLGWWLFHPAEEDFARNGWGWLGILLITGAGAFTLWAYYG